MRKLDSLDRRANNIVNHESLNVVNLPSIHTENQKRACILVQNCLEGKVIDELRNYFQINQHNYGTRNNKKLLKLLLVKTQYASKSFYFMGAKLYNSLPLAVRESKSKTSFKKFLTKHFSR